MGVKLTALFGTGLYLFAEIEKYSLWFARYCFSALFEASKFLLTGKIIYLARLISAMNRKQVIHSYNETCQSCSRIICIIFAQRNIYMKNYECV